MRKRRLQKMQHVGTRRPRLGADGAESAPRTPRLPRDNVELAVTWAAGPRDLPVTCPRLSMKLSSAEEVGREQKPDGTGRQDRRLHGAPRICPAQPSQIRSVMWVSVLGAS